MLVKVKNMLVFSSTDCRPVAEPCKPLCGIPGASFRQLCLHSCLSHLADQKQQQVAQNLSHGFPRRMLTVNKVVCYMHAEAWYCTADKQAPRSLNADRSYVDDEKPSACGKFASKFMCNTGGIY